MRRWLGGLALLLLAAGVAGHALRERIAMGLYERGAARAIQSRLCARWLCVGCGLRRSASRM